MLRLQSLISVNATRFSTTAAQRIKEDLVEVFVNDKSVKVKPGSVIIQACKVAGIDIPRFCYHERLAIAGNCRMCLVQVEKIPKMVASCAQPVASGMRIFTDSPAVKKAREGVMEFLLANHPLDCPICDQGGECDLQDQAMAFGSDRSRFRLDVQDKRAVEDKYLGPLVKTSMNRCIHCTRCVRFANEIAGVPELGTSGRGNDMQIGTYIEKTINSELSGNIIDLCPVGALTSKPYAFQARPWELKKTESIDVMDAVGSAVRIDSRGPKVYRVLPREHADINEEWLADKGRFSCDALALQRLTKPLIRSESGLFQEAEWGDALNLIAAKMNGTKGNMAAVVGDFADAESMFLLKELFKSMDSSWLALDSDNPGSDLSGSNLTKLNYTLNDIERADAILLIGSNVRHEAPLLNLRIRKNYLSNDVLIGLVGPKVDLAYEYEHLGQSMQQIWKNREFLDKLKESKRPIILVGQHVLRQEAPSLKKLIKQLPNLIKDNWNGFGVLNRSASRTAALELGYGKDVPENCRLLYLLNADNFTVPHANETFIVYQGHHGERGASLANVILPGAAYSEKDGVYVNCEGRIQSTVTAVPPPGDARPDWSMIRALSEFCGRRIPLDTLSDVRVQLLQLPSFSNGINSFIKRSDHSVIDDLKKLKEVKKAESDLITFALNDYYMTDVISRQSPTMASCSREFSGGVKLLFSS